MPLVLQAEHKKDGALSEEGWAFAASSAKERIDDPYKLPQYGDIPHIPVDWIREAKHAILRGATEGPVNAVIIDGVDTMSHPPANAANAMLKTLEEPPPGTVMMLLTDKPHAVLPTIVSRCQVMRFALLPPDVVRAELYKRARRPKKEPADTAVRDEVVIIDTGKGAKKGGKKGAKEEAGGNDLFANDLFGNDLFAGTDAGGGAGAATESVATDVVTDAVTDANTDVDIVDMDTGADVVCDPAIETAAACGSIGAAIEELEEPSGEYYQAAAALWNDCLQNDWESAVRAADRLAGGDDTAQLCQKTLKCLIHLLRIAFFKKFAASINYINLGMSYQIGLPETVTPGDVERFVRQCQDALSALAARGNERLVMANFVCTLMETLNVEE
jgi:hypothetical protein